MQVILYMAISANGYITKENHETPWCEEELDSYSSKVKEVGNIIIGKTTYDLMIEENIFEQIGNPFVVVLTSSKEKPNSDKVVFVDNFDSGLEELENKGFTIALVAGGGKTDSAALDSGKLSELYLDVEPHIFGKGIPVFSPVDSDLDLDLLDTKPIGKSGLQLHYKVK